MAGTKTFQYLETTHHVSVTTASLEGVCVSINGQDSTWEIITQRGTQITLRNAQTGQILSGHCIETEVGISVWVAGQVILLVKPSPVARGKNATGSHHGGLGPVLAPMPGTVLKVLVEQGETVEAKTPLVIMESMKMELTINAPQAGWISAINATPGEMVTMHAPLLTLKPLEEAHDALTETP